MSGDAVLVLTAADTFYHICRIAGEHLFRSDDAGLLARCMICGCCPVNILSDLFGCSLYDGEFSLRCVMPVFHAGSLGSLSAVCPQDRGICIHGSQYFAEFLLGNITRS